MTRDRRKFLGSSFGYGLPIKLRGPTRTIAKSDAKCDSFLLLPLKEKRFFSAMHLRETSFMRHDPRSISQISVAIIAREFSLLIFFFKVLLLMFVWELHAHSSTMFFLSLDDI